MNWKKALYQFIEIGLVSSLYFISCYVCMKYYNIQDYPDKSEDILLVIWNELVNVATLAPIAGVIAINWFMKKCKIKISEPFRIAWSIIGVVLILFFSFVCFFLAQLFGKGERQQTEYSSSSILRDAVGNIKNKDVLNIQLLRIRELKNNDFVEFHLHNLDNLIAGTNDVNCILFTKLRLKQHDFSYFQFALDTYEKIVESGADEYKEEFLEIINKAALDLKKRLSAISNPDNITKDDFFLLTKLTIYNI